MHEASRKMRRSRTCGHNLSRARPPFGGRYQLFFADQISGTDLGLINPGLYKIGADPTRYAAEVHPLHWYPTSIADVGAAKSARGQRDSGLRCALLCPLPQRAALPYAPCVDKRLPGCATVVSRIRVAPPRATTLGDPPSTIPNPCEDEADPIAA